jgi:aspartate/methionine/tyrosine aminotransferase
MPVYPAIARPEVLALRGSKIREVANAAMGRPDVLPFWFGESDQPTPQSIRQAAIAALEEGRTFYSHNLGQPALRAATAAYLSRLHTRPIGEDRLAITSSGVNALMIAAQAVVSPGDRVVVVDPVWPNVAEIPRILGADVAALSLRPGPEGFRLDLDQLLDALTPDTRALFLNSPNNPTGWTIGADQRRPILERCRELGVWLVADDVYERLYFGEELSAPSFLPLADPHDRLISANSFSKAWRMTGWRLGWLVAPPTLVERLGVLLEYNTSCAPDFVQAAAIWAIEGGEASVLALRDELAAARDHLIAGLIAIPGVVAPRPAGAMYAFFRLAEGDEDSDSVTLAKRLVDEVGLGLAPGAAFGEGGEGWLRWCFAADRGRLDDGLARLAAYLGRAAVTGNRTRADYRGQV